MKKTVNITVSMLELEVLITGLMEYVEFKRVQELIKEMYTEEERHKVLEYFNSTPEVTRQDAIELTAYLLSAMRVFID